MNVDYFIDGKLKLKLRLTNTSKFYHIYPRKYDKLINS